MGWLGTTLDILSRLSDLAISQAAKAGKRAVNLNTRKAKSRAILSLLAIMLALGALVMANALTTPLFGQTTSLCVTGGAVATGNPELAADCETLLGLKASLRGSTKLNWWTGRPIERWDGIKVQGGRVVEVSLPNRNLDGIIPTGFGSLSALTALDLSSNSLTGQIPTELDNLTHLTRWRLAGNRFTGCVSNVLAAVADSDLVRLSLPTCWMKAEIDGLKARIEALERALHTHTYETSTPSHIHVRTPAPIVSVTIRVAESFPPQYFVDVVSLQSDACVRFAGYDVERDGSRIAIKVWNQRPSQVDIACATVVSETETAVPLGSDFERGTTYQVTVNGEKHATFTAQ